MMYLTQHRSSSQLSSKRVSVLRGLRDAREEHLKETFFDELIKACDSQLSEPEKEFLMDYILAPKVKDKKCTMQVIPSSHRLSSTLGPHQRFTLLHTNKENREEEWQDALAPINEGLFQSKRPSKLAPPRNSQRITQSNYRSSTLQKRSSALPTSSVPENKR